MNPLSDFEREIASENYEAVEAAVGCQVKWFQSRHPWIHSSDALSAAGAAYVQAVGTFDPKLGGFKEWVSFKVDKALATLVRRQAVRNRRWPSAGDAIDAAAQPEKEPRFWLDEWLATLTPDARQVAMMVFETPFGIRLRIAELGGYETPEAFRNGVREYLRDAGWGEARIAAAFLEIKESL